MLQINASMKQKQAHGHREQTCGFQSRVGGRRGMEGGLRISRCKQRQQRLGEQQGPGV